MRLTHNFDVETGLGGASLAVLGQTLVDARVEAGRFQEGQRLADHRLAPVVELLAPLARPRHLGRRIARHIAAQRHRLPFEDHDQPRSGNRRCRRGFCSYQSNQNQSMLILPNPLAEIESYPGR